MSAEEEKYDPNLIIQAANEKLQQQQDLEGGSLVFQTALLSWVDDAREGGASMMVDPESLKEAIATLWIAYAQYLANAKQFKSAFEAYEQAVTCPVACSVGRVWLDYARFAEERGKKKKAQDVYLRALVGRGNSSTNSGSGVVTVTDEQDREVLWQEFLEMMRRKSNPDLTMEELQAAIEKEHVTKNKNDGSGTNFNSDTIITSPTATTTTSTAAAASFTDPFAPPSKRAKTMIPDAPSLDASSPSAMNISSPQGPHQAASFQTDAPSNTNEQPPQRTYVVTMEAVQAEAANFLSLLQQSELPPDVMASWMIRDGTAAAQPPEPPLFSAAPPRLQDPTGKDILGVDLALALNQRLLQPQSGKIVLEACHGLWTMALVKQKQVDEALEELKERILSATEAREAEWQNRMSVADSTTAHAVEIMNANERQAFQQTLNQEYMSVLQAMAWDFRRLLCTQQQVLHKLRVPGFESGPTVDASALALQAKICSYLHSAFYLRNRIGEAPHVAMLTKKIKHLEQEQQEQRERGPTHSPVPPSFPNSNNSNPMQRQQQPQQLSYGGMAPMQQQQQPPPNYGYQGGGPPPMQQPPPQQQQHMPPTYVYQPQGGGVGHMMQQQQQPPPNMMPPQYGQYQQQQYPPRPPPPPPPPPPPQQQYPYYQQQQHR